MKPSELKSKYWPTQQLIFEKLCEKETQSGSADLIDAVSRQVLVGGKRIRALIPVYLAESISSSPLSQDQIKSCLHLGLAVELIHSGTLCHDDIMDEDRVRRNAPTVWVSHGMPQAINAGDLLFYLAEKLIHTAPLKAEAKLDALKYLANCLCKVIHGQALEIGLKRNEALPDSDSYKSVVVGKTGGLFSLALVFGGLACGLAPNDIESLDELGMKIGERFQIRDDIIDIVGDKGRGIKASDLWESKPSWLIALACATLDPKQQLELKALLYIPRTQKKESDVSRLLELLEISGAIAQAKTYLAQADLEEDLPSELKKWESVLPSLLALIQAPTTDEPGQ